MQRKSNRLSASGVFFNHNRNRNQQTHTHYRFLSLYTPDMPQRTIVHAHLVQNLQVYL
jgi:hypothetical protein